MRGAVSPAAPLERHDTLEAPIGRNGGNIVPLGYELAARNNDYTMPLGHIRVGIKRRDKAATWNHQPLDKRVRRVDPWALPWRALSQAASWSVMYTRAEAATTNCAHW